MNTTQQAHLQELSEKVRSLTNDLDSGPVSNLYLVSEKNEGQPIVIAGNQEGLVYLASVCLSLAREMSEQQHQHFDESGVLSESQQDFVIKFQTAPWAT
jgi:hypothetical protein